jgi:hypothetical protein
MYKHLDLNDGIIINILWNMALKVKATEPFKLKGKQNICGRVAYFDT